MMGKTAKLRLITRSLLKQIIPEERLFYGFNNGDNLWKLNYKFVSSTQENSSDHIILEINIWDDDSVHIDELADQVENILNYESVNNHNCFPTYYMESRRSIEENDKRIERRMLTYSVVNYEGGKET